MLAKGAYVGVNAFFSEEDGQSPGAEVTGDCELQGM